MERNLAQNLATLSKQQKKTQSDKTNKKKM
jgi:hypothetical protein